MMQRFNIVSIEDGFYRHEYSEAGPYLLYSDAHALEVRNQELEAKITELRFLFRLLKADARELPMELFDGIDVYRALSDKGLTRTNPANVCDVLDAVVKLIRARKAQTEDGE